MIWQIVRREFLDHLNSLRFALTTLLFAALMVTNALTHIQTYPEQIQKYSKNVIASRNAVKSRTQLYAQLQKGPGDFYKRPASLAFISHGGDAFLPGKIGSGGLWRNWYGAPLESIWWMEYPTVNPNAKSLRPKMTIIDWAFIITYLLSLIPLLFTFDALSGERERGTLRLCLANPISRHDLLLGKFLGALTVILVAFFSAVLVNLAIISTDNWTQLGTADWARVGFIVLIASCYASIFVAIGLGVSALTREPRLSLVLLLLIWVTLVVFMPSILGTLATKWMPPVQTHYQFQRAKKVAIEQIEKDYIHQMEVLEENPSKEANLLRKLQKLAEMSPEKAEELVESEDESRAKANLHAMAERVNKDVEIREHLNRQQLAAQSDQVLRIRQITRCSPAGIVQYALESMASTGFNRHLQFLEHVDLHIRHFRNFIIETDQADPKSPHLIGIPEGMSKKPILPEALPIFEDEITFQKTFNAAILDMLLLVLLLGVFLCVALLVFLRAEV